MLAFPCQALPCRALPCLTGKGPALLFVSQRVFEFAAHAHPARSAGGGGERAVLPPPLTGT